ncbi:MAG TPA: hypothetical protein VFX91_12830 [Alcanivorax sp.]|nr:hypothetical protein [Alcanivorax sp.]
MDAPAPWTLRGHAYAAALALPEDLRREQGGTAEALGPATGRLGLVMFVAYQRSEVGPWLPERWRRLGQVRDNQQFVFAPSVRGRLGLAGLGDAWGNGEDFPQLQHGRAREAAYLPDFRLDFPKAGIQPLS